MIEESLIGLIAKMKVFGMLLVHRALSRDAITIYVKVLLMNCVSFVPGGGWCLIKNTAQDSGLFSRGIDCCSLLPLPWPLLLFNEINTFINK